VVDVTNIGYEAIETKGWWQAHRWLILRRVSQISILGLFLLGPVLGVWVIKGNLASSLLMDTIPMSEPLLILQMLMTGLVPASTALIGVAVVVGFYFMVGGRAYCAWVCPVNMVTDSANWLREKLGLRGNATLGRQLRYWMLLMVLVLAWASGTMAYEQVNPVPVLHRGIIYGLSLSWSLIFAIFMFDLLIARRGWCGHLCPMGALYALIGTYSPLRIVASNRSACDDCMECYSVCPEPQVIKPALKGAEQGNGPIITSGACTNCGRCVDICAERVFEFGVRFK
jgi:ferredoxin-type protein NapH